MTFILNLIHKDFSALFYDLQANTEGPTTIKAGSLTINVMGKATIIGFDKFAIDRTGRLAVAFAGNSDDHSYRNTFSSADGIQAGLDQIDACMKSYVSSNQRSDLREDSIFMNNDCIATFYDDAAGRFFLNHFSFSKIHYLSRLYMAPTGRAGILSIGSGSEKFEEVVGKDEIASFKLSVASLDDISRCISWVREAYEKVSLAEPTVSKEFRGYISTIRVPIFTKLDIPMSSSVS